MVEQAEFKLPLLGKSLKLKPLPGQDPRREYGVIWDACRQPGEGWGYVFEFTGRRAGRILAWLTAAGAAYACDGPLAFVPDGEPQVLASHLPDNENVGQVEARGVGLPLRMVSRFVRSPHTGTFTFEQPARDVGPYAGASLDMRTFMAVGFLAFVHIPQTMGAPAVGGRAADVIDSLLRPPLPDSLDILVRRVRSAAPGGVSGFELYAARLLEEAGSARLRSLASRTGVEVVRLSSTGLVWLRFDEAVVDAEERQCVLAVESALNRLIFVQEAMEVLDGVGALYAGCDEAFCSQQDWRCLCYVASGAVDLMRGCERENPLREVYGAQGSRGGEWDVRTRFAQACEALRLPFRMEYRFDADAAAGTLSVECSAPLPEAFPAVRWDAARGTWTDMRVLRGWAASAYALRLSAALAAAAFGAGIGIARAYVTVRPGGLDEPAGMSLLFDRIAFAADVLPRIAEGALDAEAMACDPAAVLALLSPADRSAAFLENGFFGTATPLDAGLGDRRLALWEDKRSLPAPLAEELRADLACELDVLHDEDADLTARVPEALKDAESSPLSSIVLLEDIAAQADERERQRAAADGPAAADVLAADDGPAAGLVPLYCANPIVRMLVGLTGGDAKTRYRKASDAAFAAQNSLSRLYLQVGDAPRALTAAEASIVMAPTSQPGYLSAVVVHMEEDRFAEAETLLRRALRVAVDRRECSYLRYRLAFALWKQGQLDLALACYAVVAAENGEMAPQAEKEIAELMAQMGVRERPSIDAAEDTLHAAGISIGPPFETAALLARVAVGLADAGLLAAAAFPARAVAQLNSEDALYAVARSLENSTAVPAR
ncbi:tetratricopeptide repeat protein [Arabiibacter massiliensis]|uniref:tetratricopeptide repeat protein n=1 Tax=Arabiibacter massiliensis TaxID=1870985 RepID=UPI0009BB8BDE|nr:tetratricopeptide repeat protein [Arabiibacter massiliensis]